MPRTPGTPLDYPNYVIELANLLVVDPADPEFLIVLPNIIDYADGRLYRELNLLNTVRRETDSLTPNIRDFTLPDDQGRFVAVNAINCITPASTVPQNGTRNPLTPTSLEFLDFCYPNASVTGRPSFFAMVTDQTIVVGPWPDQDYVLEVIGPIRPTPLSSVNTTTFLTLYLPDLYVAASMVFASGYQKNFGAQSDDPKMAASWEGQYQTLIA